MLYSEHLRVGRKGISIVDRNGQQIGLFGGIKKALRRVYAVIEDLELFILRIAGFIPIYTIRWVIYKLAGVRIGRGSHIHMGAQFFHPTGVKIGRGSILGQNIFLDGRAKLSIGNNVDIASDVMIYNSEHDLSSPIFAAVDSEVEIGDYAFIGPRVIILPGVKIGRGAVVGAGAVVTKDVDELMIVGGVPAKEIGKRSLGDFSYRLGRSRLFQ